jgi:hypothetical protein
MRRDAWRQKQAPSRRSPGGFYKLKTYAADGKPKEARQRAESVLALSPLPERAARDAVSYRKRPGAGRASDVRKPSTFYGGASLSRCKE